MAPSTRRAASIAPRKRGRPAMAKAPVLESESASSAPTPADSVSESGDYSTPATSNAVTPAPSVAKSTPSNGLRSRIAVEIPSSSSRVTSSRGRRLTGPISYTVNDSDDDDDIDTNDRDAVLARRLQCEEDEKFAASSTAKASFKAAGQRRTRGSRVTIANADDDDDDKFIADVNHGLKTTSANSNGKGKGKATAKFTISTKRKAASVRDTESSFGSDTSDNDDEDDEPLTRSAPVRKKRKSELTPIASDEDPFPNPLSESDYESDSGADSDDGAHQIPQTQTARASIIPLRRRRYGMRGRTRAERNRQELEIQHPELKTMWTSLKEMPLLNAGKAKQPASISRQLKPFQLEGLAWMKAMELEQWKGGLLGDEMGLGKTIQAVSLIMSDFPTKDPTLVLVPPVALMQWTAEIESYTDGKLKTLVFHGSNSKAKNLQAKDLKKYNVIMMSYNTLESLYRKQEKGYKRKDDEGVSYMYQEKSEIHKIKFHRVILDEAHCIKSRVTMTAKACFALKSKYRWCLTGTPLQNRIGEFFSLIRFLNIEPFASYFCKNCPCSTLEWSMNEKGACTHCGHYSMAHVSVFNQELLNPIQKYGNSGEGKDAFGKLRLLTEKIMLRRLKKDHTDSMELPVKEIFVDRQFFGEEENDFANSIMTNNRRKFNTYAAEGVLLNNYANIFGLIMQMRQVADHPDLILKKSGEGGQNVLVCCICDEAAEEAIRSKCQHDFCRTCAKDYIESQDAPDCPRCHIQLQIDLEQPEMEQDEALVKKSSIINRIKMENWTSSSKIELLVHSLHQLRSDNASHKSIIFSQFTSMLQLVEWRLRRAGITTVMLDGSMQPAQRQASINHFMNNVDVECFLVSLKAGGVALNLTEASQVFIVDPWWNPAAEWQSADRCHRIGQTRPCTITRLCIEDSVESRMVLLQEKKTNMINSTINSDDAAMESLTPADLQFLFRGS